MAVVSDRDWSCLDVESVQHFKRGMVAIVFLLSQTAGPIVSIVSSCVARYTGTPVDAF